MQSSRWGLLQTQATHCSDKLFGVSLFWVPDLTSKNCRLEVVREQTKICCLGQFSVDESHVLRQDFWFGGCQVSQVVFWVGHQTHQTFSGVWKFSACRSSEQKAWIAACRKQFVTTWDDGAPFKRGYSKKFCQKCAGSELLCQVEMLWKMCDVLWGFSGFSQLVQMRSEKHKSISLIHDRALAAWLEITNYWLNDSNIASHQR